MTMSKNKETVNDAIDINYGLLFFLAGLALVGYWLYNLSKEPADPRANLTPEQICESWKGRYPTISYNEFPEGVLKTQSGETWVIELSPDEWSGIVKLQNRYANMKPAGSVKILLPNGITIEDNPSKDIHLQNKNGFRFKGENCYKISN